ncbi:hypothetical protein JGS43_33635, partial [Streptomyces sp. P01-F02]|nr:hypothetical protein [Streptomyces poriferorum]
MTGHSGNADRNSAAEADEERAVAQALALVGRQAPSWAATGGAPGPGPAASGSSKDTPQSADPTWTAPAASPRDEDPTTSTTTTSTTATSTTATST